MRSLRFRLPAIFLAGVLVAGIVTAVLAIRLFQDYTRDDTLTDLRRQASGLALLYSDQAGQSVGRGTNAPCLRRPDTRTGDRRPPLLRGRRHLPRADLRPAPPAARRARPLGARAGPGAGVRVQACRTRTRPTSRSHSRSSSAARPSAPSSSRRPKADLTASWLVLFQRVALAFAAGIVVATGLVWYLSRRLDEAGARALARGRRGRRGPLRHRAAAAALGRRDRPSHRTVRADDRPARRVGGARRATS